jgi:hypothetical protein
VQEIGKYLKLGGVAIAELKFGVECDSPEMQRIYQVAADYRVPVLMHWQYKMHFYGFERFAHQDQRERLKLLAQPATPPFPRRPHREHLPALPALPARQGARNLRLQLADIEVPPTPLRRVVVAGHRRRFTMRALLASPQLRRVLDTDHNLALLLHVVHRLHSPGIAQHQKLLKQFFGYHCSPYSTRFPSYYPLQTSRNRKALAAGFHL